MNTVQAAWHSDPAERGRLVGEAQDWLARAGADSAAGLLVVLGRLGRMHADAELVELRSAVRDPDALVAQALSGFDFLALEGAALDFGIASPDLSAEAGVAERAREQVLRALAVRDEVDLLLAGAETLLGQPPVLSDEARLALQEFDGVVEPILFRALPLNQARQAALHQVAPELRARLWWYARGCELEPNALQALAQAAEVLHTFPEAGRELEALQRVERGLADLFRSREAELSQGGCTLQTELTRQREDPMEREQNEMERTGPGRGRRR